MDESLHALPFDSHCLDAELTALIISQSEPESIFDGYEKFIAKLRDSNKKLLAHMCMSAIELQSQDAVVEHSTFDDELFLKDDDGANFAGIYGKARKIFYLDYITKSTKIADSLRARWHQLAHFLNQTDGFFLHRAYPFDDTANKSHNYFNRFALKPKNIENEIEHLMPLNVMLGSGELLIHQLNNYGREQIEVFQTLNHEKKLCIVDSYREASECGMLMRVPKPTWTSFLATIHKSVFYSLIGMSFYGAEVCGGHYGPIAEDLCIRWYQFAIFSPLFYVNSQRMPMKFTKYAERIMVHTIRTRYSLLGYMWTCMHVKTVPLLRPIRYAYPEINRDIEIIVEHQFLFGDALMIVAIAEPLVVELNMHFPETFFEMWSGLEMPQNTTHFSIVMHDIPIFIRAGHIVALNLAYESLSVAEARQQPYQLIIALSCTERYSCNARGEHHVLDGLEFKFEASEIHLNITVITQNPVESRNAICGPERFASSDFRFAKIYGLGEFKEKYRNDYLSLNLNICDVEDWKESFGFSFSI
jgi:Glycosyl hydrolases family 31